MIRAIIQDISQIIDRLQKTHSFDSIVYKLDAEVKYCLHNAFLDNRINDFEVIITKGPDIIHLKVKIREDVVDHWDHLGFVIDRMDVVNIGANKAYDRAMQGI